MNCSYTRVKMCGMTRLEDVQHAIKLGVDAIGLIFYPPSPRCISIEKARELLQNLPPFIDVVAVLVNPEIDRVRQLLSQLPIQLLQFHGDESPEFCRQFNFSFIKAIQVESASQIRQAAMNYSEAKGLLLDAPSLTQKGGTGKVFDWNVIPKDISSPYILAGGLNETNVQQAIAVTHPYAIDINSGIESEPGIKNHLKMNQIMKMIRGIKK